MDLKKKGVAVKTVSVIVAASFCLSAFPVRAGFVEDFLDEAQGAVNVTQAGITEAGALNVVTGGGFVYRVPRKEFVPFSVTPPSLKAGCGGIDVFLGAFSIPSREEFVSFLKSVGTALPGLAFQLALQTMAPDLNEMVGRYADMIRSYTNRYSDSCSAAQALLEDTGAAAQLTKAVYSAKNALRSSGAVSDQSEADKKVRDNGSAAITNATVKRDSAGNVIDAPELNLTWALINNGKFAGSTATELKEVMMTLAGTTVFTKTGDGEDAVISARHIAGVDLLPVLFGEARSGGSITKLKCDETKQCLNLTTETMNDVSLVDTMKTAAQNYRTALEKRDPSLVTDKELVLLGASTGVPLLRILNLAALSKYQGIADGLINIYVEAAAYELIAAAVESLASDIRAALSASSAGSVSSTHVEHAERLQARVRQIQSELHEREDKLMQAMARASNLVTQLEHIERSLTRTGSDALMQSMPATVSNNGA